MNKMIAVTGTIGLNLVYLTVLLVGSPLILWVAWRHGKYREGWAEKLLGRVPYRNEETPCLWFHAVSVGEVNLLRTVIPEVQREFPGWSVVVSTTTKTGHDLARRQHADLLTFYCPLDFSWAVRRAMRRIRPTALVLTELELWPNLIYAAKKHDAKVLLINGRMSERSFHGYRRMTWFVRRLLRQLDVIAVQDEQYHSRFLALGADPHKTRVTGSLKFDGTESERSNPNTYRLSRLWQVNDCDRVLLAGSTQAPEERLALEAFDLLRLDHPEARLILVPRHPERFDEVARLLESRGDDWCRRSELVDAHPRRTNVLLVDTIGELRWWWGVATAGFVGGSMGSRGGQNMIEPAAFGVAVSFGPHTQNFRDVVQMLLAAQAAKVVADGDALRAFWTECLARPDYVAEIGHRGQQVVREQQGATQRTLDWMADVMRGRRSTETSEAA
jgi:3-deoxy-D-manno-octulosonic-acid transferase